jgi:hypothetical protein
MIQLSVEGGKDMVAEEIDDIVTGMMAVTETVKMESLLTQVCTMMMRSLGLSVLPDYMAAETQSPVYHQESIGAAGSANPSLLAELLRNCFRIE